MSQDYDKHIILHHLDDPLRVLYWTLDEALVMIAPPFVGLILDQILLGVFAAALGHFFLKLFKKKLGGGALRHAMYWYLPHNKKVLRKTPPSYKREYIG